ncbi:MAG: YetF domain-containing protein [Flavisolibacter sp.]
MRSVHSNQYSTLHYILFGDENWSYLPIVFVKSLIIFIVVIIALRFIGRRGIMQGVFEVLTIITLGSASGDPMLYKSVGILPAIFVFISIIALYRITNHLVAKYSRMETLVEGRFKRFVRDGRFDFESYRSNELNKDNLFSDLRKKGVSQLGQVTRAYLEAGGEVSVFFYPDHEVKHGLPTLPEPHLHQLKEIKNEGIYSCGYCGYTEFVKATKEHECRICKRKDWIPASRELRIV